MSLQFSLKTKSTQFYPFLLNVSSLEIKRNIFPAFFSSKPKNLEFSLIKSSPSSNRVDQMPLQLNKPWVAKL